ncbi:U4/u6 small nuclear ribonucleoprotein prp3, partial [Globisporangium splendens]
MDAGEGNRRKRKSRFSDAVDTPNGAAATATAPAQPPARSAALDPAALAKLAAAKIARAIPGTAATAQVPTIPFAGAATARSNGDVDEQIRIAEEKRRRTDQIYKSVQEQMSHIQALLRKPGAAAAPTTSTTAKGGSIASGTFMPAPLLLDEQGRQIDAAGNVIADPLPATVATLKANQSSGTTTARSSSTQQNANPYLSHRTVDKEDAVDAVDPRLTIKKRETRGAKSFQFVTHGTYIKQAEQVRAREAKKMLAGFTSGRNPRGYQKESIVPVDEAANADTDATSKDAAATSMELYDVDVPMKPESQTPDVEWWDVEYLPKDKRANVDKFGLIKIKSRKENPEITVTYTEMKIKYCGTMHVIEHPARVASIVKKDEAPVVLPLMLTAAERKKIRRQNRADREKEKQDKIALGLLPPPEPKVKLSNMMRVLADQAVADPSAIERKVRQQVAQREKNHEMRNLARKLTPEERREKKLRKIKEDAAGDIHVAVFKVPDLSNPQHRFKVDVNAQQFHLTGGVLICKEDNLNMVVVEGGKKAIKHYTRLLTKRIHWLTSSEHDDSDNESGNDDDDDAESKGNGCKPVWQGVVARKAFTTFRFQECRTAATARKVMEAKGVVHYWDLVEKSTS